MGVRFGDIQRQGCKSALPARESFSLVHAHKSSFWLILIQILIPRIRSQKGLSNFGMPRNSQVHLLEHRFLGPILEILIQEVWNGACKFAFLTSSQVMLMMLDPTVGKHCPGIFSQRPKQASFSLSVPIQPTQTCQY